MLPKQTEAPVPGLYRRLWWTGALHLTAGVVLSLSVIGLLVGMPLLWLGWRCCACRKESQSSIAPG